MLEARCEADEHLILSEIRRNLYKEIKTIDY